MTPSLAGRMVLQFFSLESRHFLRGELGLRGILRLQGHIKPITRRVCLPRPFRVLVISSWLGACLLSCGDKQPVGLGGGGTRQFAVANYSYPVAFPLGPFYFCDHRPLKRINYDPFYGFYSYDYCDSATGFWRLASDGSGLTKLLSFDLSEPDWNPTGTALAYQRGKQIWVVPATADSINEAGAVQITSGGNSFAPQWSPNGSLIAYSVNIGADAGIRAVSGLGGTPRRIGSFAGLEPDWSPNGARFAFFGQVGSLWGIGVCDTNGANVEVIYARANALFSSPRWSPDGSRIAFTARMTNADLVQLYRVSPDGTSFRQLTTVGVLSNFSWTRDGSEILVTRFDPLAFNYTNGTLWAVNAESGTLRQLTTNPSCGP